MNWQLIVVSGFALVVGGLATYRLSVLVVDDTITQRLRDLAGRSAFISELVSCIACTSIWIGIGVTVGFYFWSDVFFWLMLPFAFSAVALIADTHD